MPESRSTPRISGIKQARSLTLVPNRRVHDVQLAQVFQRAGDETQVLVAPALDVLSRWVEQTSARIDLLRGRPVAATADRLLLDQAWQQAVSAQPEWTSANECYTLARSARTAERLLRHWCPAHESPWESPGFHGWRMAVRAALQSQHLFTPEDWLCHLQAQLDQPGELPLRLPAVIELRGFIEITRLEQSLLDALQRRGIRIIDATGGQGDRSGCEDEPMHGSGAADERANRVLHAFDSTSEEFRAAADWARNCLRRGSQRIAVVVNGLDALASQLAPVFDRIIHPQDGMRIALNGDGLYHLADGSRLAQHAVIGDALFLLRLSAQGRTARHPFPHISRLLLNPYLAAWHSERQARARFEVMLRGEGIYYQSLQQLGRLLERWKLQDQLPVLHRLLAHTDRIAGSADIGTALLNRLLDWGWPGPVARGSLSAGQVRQFTGLLERLRQADPGSVQLAIATLSRWCRDTHLTERGGPLSPIQLLSPADAVGQNFDAAWVMNVHDGNWPGHPASNPFLPHDMVRHIPRATPEGELNFTRKVQRQLDLLAPEVHYSWNRSGDDIPRLASPLLAPAAAVASGVQPAPHWPVLSQASAHAPEYPTGYAGHRWLQALDDMQGLPLQRAEGSRMPGGAAMVKNQSTCPLMAYLTHRLKLRFEPMPGPFADYAYRGKLLHEALYQLFREQAGQPGLPASDGIAAAVDRAMHRHHAQQRLAPPALRAEQQRLQRLLQQWLVFERLRQGFGVAALEEKRHVVVQGLALDIRLDRIDRLNDGRQLIIDYKSGAVDVAGWLRKRLGEPQLPLYAVLLDLAQPGSVGGLALASVRAGDCRMAGVVDDPLAAGQTLYASDNRRSAFGRAFAGWEDLFQHWKAGIGSLLEEIAAGHAANCLYDQDGLRYAGLDTVLRRSEGEAWLLAHSAAWRGDHDD